VLAPYLQLNLWFASNVCRNSLLFMLGVCGLFNDISVGCLILGQRKGEPEAEAARLAKRGQVAYNSQYNYIQSSDYVIQASLEGVC